MGIMVCLLLLELAWWPLLQTARGELTGGFTSMMGLQMIFVEQCMSADRHADTPVVYLIRL
jgi:hypothetical protein